MKVPYNDLSRIHKPLVNKFMEILFEMYHGIPVTRTTHSNIYNFCIILVGKFTHPITFTWMCYKTVAKETYRPFGT